MFLPMKTCSELLLVRPERDAAAETAPEGQN
jgi:hypothetical protein